MCRAGQDMALAAVLLGLGVVPAAAEDITLTTYYPSPRGVYRQLRVGDATGAAGPSALHVVQSAAAPAFRVDDDVSGDLSPFIILDTGNVGIGTPAPANKLRIVSGGPAGTVDLHVDGRIRTGDATNSGGVLLGDDDTGFVGETGGNIGFWTNGVSGARWAMLINKDTGNVGIGSPPTPANKLRIAGGGPAGTVDLSVDGRIRTGDGANQGGVWLGSSNTGFVGETGSADPSVGFWTNGAGWALAVNKANGNVGINTTAPAAKLDVRGSASVGPTSNPPGIAALSAAGRVVVRDVPGQRGIIQANDVRVRDADGGNAKWLSGTITKIQLFTHPNAQGDAGQCRARFGATFDSDPVAVSGLPGEIASQVASRHIHVCISRR